MDTDALLAERGKTHGDFTDHARVTQTLKRFVYTELRSAYLTHVEREAIDMILHKIGRIMAGNPHYKDHWADIAGYAKLVADRCET